MKKLPTTQHAACGRSRPLGVSGARPDRSATTPRQAYKILHHADSRRRGIDYVTADSVNRRFMSPAECGECLRLDTYKLAGTLAKASGMASRSTRKPYRPGLRNPATFFNTKTLETTRPFRRRVRRLYLRRPDSPLYYSSHRAPNLLVVDSKDGSIVDKVEAIGPNGANAAVEQGVSDGEGHLL